MSDDKRAIQRSDPVLLLKEGEVQEGLCARDFAHLIIDHGYIDGEVGEPPEFWPLTDLESTYIDPGQTRSYDHGMIRFDHAFLYKDEKWLASVVSITFRLGGEVVRNVPDCDQAYDLLEGARAPAVAKLPGLAYTFLHRGVVADRHELWMLWRAIDMHRNFPTPENWYGSVADLIHETVRLQP